MKKKAIFLLAILLMASFVTSCSNDDDNEKTEFTSTLTANGSEVKITNLEGKAVASFIYEFWVMMQHLIFIFKGISHLMKYILRERTLPKTVK